MESKELMGTMVSKGYTKIVQLAVRDSDAELGEYMEALRLSDNYVDMVVVFDDDTGDAHLFAKKLQDRVAESVYRKAIVKRLDRQTNKGLEKYGRLLHTNNLNAIARLEYLAEELTDGLQYIEHVKAGLHDVFDIQAGLVGRMVTLSMRLPTGRIRDELVEISCEANRLLGVVMGYEDNEQGRKEDTGQSE